MKLTALKKDVILYIACHIPVQSMIETVITVGIAAKPYFYNCYYNIANYLGGILFAFFNILIIFFDEPSFICYLNMFIIEKNSQSRRSMKRFVCVKIDFTKS